MPYISLTNMKAFNKASSQLKSTRKELDALKKSSINPRDFKSVIRTLKETRTKLELASKKSKGYSKLYVGLKERYSYNEDLIKQLKKNITNQETALNNIESKAKSYEYKYKKALSQSSTSRSMISKMKIQHQKQMRMLGRRLSHARGEARMANAKVSDLLKELAEVEKNERQAREGSLTQAVINTRDLVFDKTIASNLGAVGESSSRGLALLTGLVVAGFMISRVD